MIGQRVDDLIPPVHIIDRSIVKRNCALMSSAIAKLGVQFRAHVKTHKTIELAQLQIGDGAASVRLIASTIPEIEHLLPWLLRCVADRRTVNVTYGLPITPSALRRLGTIASQLGPDSISLFIDHPAHVDILNEVNESTWPGLIPVFINIDVGYGREGVAPKSKELRLIAKALSASTKISLLGVYTHAGHSYSSDGQEQALKYMADELTGLEEAASIVQDTNVRISQTQASSRLISSLGATPTTTAAQNLLKDDPSVQTYRSMLHKLNATYEVEFHAGNYPVLDLQQLATRARPIQADAEGGRTLLSPSDIAVKTLVEVSSLYSDRSNRPEAMMAAGSLVMGREPCKSYPGWGIVTPWPARTGPFYDPHGDQTGWIVKAVSQEHGVLSWEGPTVNMRKLHIGEKIMLWPNHACIAGAHFEHYVVVDSDSEDANIIRDVWKRCHGW